MGSGGGTYRARGTVSRVADVRTYGGALSGSLGGTLSGSLEGTLSGILNGSLSGAGHEESLEGVTSDDGGLLGIRFVSYIVKYWAGAGKRGEEGRGEKLT